MKKPIPELPFTKFIVTVTGYSLPKDIRKLLRLIKGDAVCNAADEVLREMKKELQRSTLSRHSASCYCPSCEKDMARLVSMTNERLGRS
jgi:hypothetical protein